MPISGLTTLEARRPRISPARTSSSHHHRVPSRAAGSPGKDCPSDQGLSAGGFITLSASPLGKLWGWCLCSKRRTQSCPSKGHMSVAQLPKLMPAPGAALLDCRDDFFSPQRRSPDPVSLPPSLLFMSLPAHRRASPLPSQQQAVGSGRNRRFKEFVNPQR